MTTLQLAKYMHFDYRPNGKGDKSKTTIFLLIYSASIAQEAFTK
jgi:hypothetical protein